MSWNTKKTGGFRYESFRKKYSELLLQGSFQEDEVCLPGADTAVQLSVTTIMITSPVNTPASLATAAPCAVSDLNWLLHEDT